MILPAALAHADGLIITAGRPGGAGLQADAAVLSPRPARPVDAALGWQTYVVRPGDTLTTIAARFGLTPAEVAGRNALTDLNRVEVGRPLRIALEAPQPFVLPVVGPFERVQFWPWPPVQGQTLVVWLQSRSTLTLTVSLASQTYPVHLDNGSGWAMIPIAALAAPVRTPLTLTVGSANLALRLPIQTGSFETQQIPPSASDPIYSQPAKMQAELERMTTLFAGQSADGWSPERRFRNPLDSVQPQTSPFGSRRTYGDDPTLVAHTGEDYAAAAGTPVFAPASGVVALAESLFVRGNAVVLDHGRGVFTGYWHLQAISVKTGERVEAGQKLGEVGNTGLSTGAHLHWELRVAGVAVDPLQWVGSCVETLHCNVSTHDP